MPPHRLHPAHRSPTPQGGRYSPFPRHFTAASAKSRSHTRLAGAYPERARRPPRCGMGGGHSAGDVKTQKPHLRDAVPRIASDRAETAAVTTSTPSPTGVAPPTDPMQFIAAPLRQPPESLPSGKGVHERRPASLPEPGLPRTTPGRGAVGHGEAQDHPARLAHRPHGPRVDPPDRTGAGRTHDARTEGHRRAPRNAKRGLSADRKGLRPQECPTLAPRAADTPGNPTAPPEEVSPPGVCPSRRAEFFS